jgi:WD40 repeat protein
MAAKKSKAPAAWSGDIACVVFSPDGSTLGLAHGNSVSLVEPATGNERQRLDHDEEVWGLQFGPGGTVVTWTEGHRVRAWDARTGRPTGEPLAFGARIEAMEIDARTGELAMVTERIVDGLTDRKLERAKLPSLTALASCEASQYVAIRPDATRAVMGEMNRVTVVDAATFATVTQLVTLGGAASLYAYGRGVDRIAGGNPDGVILVWDGATGKIVATLEGHDSNVTTLDLSADGETVVSAADGEPMALWSVSQKRVLGRPKDAPKKVDLLTLHPDGHSVALVRNGSKVIVEVLSIPELEVCWHIGPPK